MVRPSPVRTLASDRDHLSVEDGLLQSMGTVSLAISLACSWKLAGACNRIAFNAGPFCVFGCL